MLSLDDNVVPRQVRCQEGWIWQGGDLLTDGLSSGLCCTCSHICSLTKLGISIFPYLVFSFIISYYYKFDIVLCIELVPPQPYIISKTHPLSHLEPPKWRFRFLFPNQEVLWFETSSHTPRSPKFNDHL